MTWTPTPLEALLDVDQVIEAWRLRGITIHRARPARAAGGLHKKQAANAMLCNFAERAGCQSQPWLQGPSAMSALLQCWCSAPCCIFLPADSQARPACAADPRAAALPGPDGAPAQPSRCTCSRASTPRASYASRRSTCRHGLHGCTPVHVWSHASATEAQTLAFTLQPRMQVLLPAACHPCLQPLFRVVPASKQRHG